MLWQVTSYRAALDTKKRRLRAQDQLWHRCGQDWHRNVPDDLASMLPRTGRRPRHITA